MSERGGRWGEGSRPSKETEATGGLLRFINMLRANPKDTKFSREGEHPPPGKSG